MNSRVTDAAKMADSQKARVLSELLYLVALKYGTSMVLSVSLSTIPKDIVIEWHIVGDLGAITVTEKPLSFN